MKYEEHEDPVATRSASPSASAEARTSEPLRSTASHPVRPRAAGQFRDPDRYQIINEHGRGGLGRVSRAHDHDLGRDVAIKELISRGNVSEVRFLREALITARLEHPGIVPVHEAGRWPDGTPFYAMKLVAGRPLRDLIAERTTVEERIGLLHHVIAVADAIAYAHGRNIIHRDLKPANVIVGDFGETIVIDWGLAKDLSTTEESTLGGAPFRVNRDNDLTAAGSILGTPAYMAPEQERGEHVDQRADVFAIGAMLWELCAVQKVPPTDPQLRHRMLRRAGIDEDLITIVDKALAPEANRRYADAGALAADLKSFKSGARIAARHYSVWALLTHWMRRHRTVAISAVAVFASLLAGVGLYVRSVASERDRADASEEHARRAHASAVVSLDALTLKHAQLLLTTDPSAAIDALSTYQGSDHERANQIRAEARGRGVAALRATPHTGNIRWAEGSSDGTIVSISTDGTIARTKRDGSSIVLSWGITNSAKMSYSRSRRLIAYACDPSDLCFYDLERNSRPPIAPIFSGIHPVGISFAQDGGNLAVLSRDGTLRIIDVTVPIKPVIRLTRKTAGGTDVVFFRDDIVVAGSLTGVEFVHMDGSSEAFHLPHNSYWDTDHAHLRFALATIQGDALVFEGSRIHVAARTQLCHGPVIGLRFIPERERIAYGCRDGAIGIWDIQRNLALPRARVDGHADLLSVDEAGDHIFAAGGNGVVMAIDLRTELVTSFRGHAFRVTAITPPTPEYPFLISADVGGALRAWSLPPKLVSVAISLNSQFNTAIFNKEKNTVIATTFLPELATYSPSAGTRAVTSHEPYALSLVQSNNARTFATYGMSELVEIWSFKGMTRDRVINTQQGSVSQASFVGDSDELVTSGHDGRLVRWAPSGEQELLAQIEQPIVGFALLPARRSIVFGAVDGSLWLSDTSAKPVLIRAPSSRVTRIVALPDQRHVLAGFADGDLVAIDSKSWRQDVVLHASGAVREIAITSNARWIAIATNDGTIHIGIRGDDEADLALMTWLTLSVRARHQILTSDGLLIAVCTDGTIWLYSIPTRHWFCVPIASADLRWVAVAADESAAAALDVEGRLFWIDLSSARQLLAADNVFEQTLRM